MRRAITLVVCLLLAVSAAGVASSQSDDFYNLDNLVHSDTVDYQEYDQEVQGMTFDDDGDRLYLVDWWDNNVSIVTLGTAWEISTAQSNTNVTLANQNYINDIEFNDDGTKMYIIEWRNGTVDQYSLSSAYDPSTATLDSSTSLNVDSGSIASIEWSNDGTRMFLSSGVADDTQQIYQYDVSTPFDASTAIHDSNVSFSTTVSGTSKMAIEFNGDGTKLFVAEAGTSTIHQFELSESYNASSAVETANLTRQNPNEPVAAIAWGKTGGRFYTAIDNVFVLEQYNIVVPTPTPVPSPTPIHPNATNGTDDQDSFIGGQTDPTIHNITTILMNGLTFIIGGDIEQSSWLQGVLFIVFAVGVTGVAAVASPAAGLVTAALVVFGAAEAGMPAWVEIPLYMLLGLLLYVVFRRVNR